LALVELKQLHKQDVLHGFSLMVEEHEQLGIKMTHNESKVLFQLITGEQLPSSGTVKRADGVIIHQCYGDDLYDGLTVKHYLVFFKRLFNAECDISTVLQACSLQDLANRKIKQLTAEQQQRVALARLYVAKPTLALLESPLGHNPSDEGIELYLRSLHALQQAGITTLVTSYFWEELVLLSDVIYQYNSRDGLVKTDVEPDTGSDDDVEATPSIIQPSGIFKVASKLEDKTVFFSPSEIDYIESVNGVSNIRIGDESFPSSLTMNELETKMMNFGFFRCHRSYLVNLQRISELVSYAKNSYTLILKGQSKTGIPLSRTRVDQMKSLLEI